ncbi:hypothetical protein [Streptomyces sp. NPDC001642]
MALVLPALLLGEPPDFNAFLAGNGTSGSAFTQQTVFLDLALVWARGT